MSNSSIKKEINTVLVAIINEHHDYARIENERWYRIPVDKAPPIIRNRQAKFIAFYPTAKFKENKWKIGDYGKIRKITEVGRKDLFPDESAYSNKASRRYYKIELEKFETLPEPIVSRRGHRITFVPTSERRFFNYTDVNFLFNGSSLEDKLFSALTDASVPTERQWVVNVKTSTYILDFAIFCQERPIDVECDGDTWHDQPERVHYDKQRNNDLESYGWSVLRFTQDDILHRMEKTASLLYDTINRNGGYQVVNDPGKYNYVNRGQQLRFDF